MAEKSMFFNSVEGDERAYSQADMAAVFSGIALNGVLEGLDVTIVSGGISLSIGKAIINGYVYHLDEALELTVEVRSVRRYDRIVLRLNLSERSIRAAVLTGSGMTMPELTQNNIIYEISIAGIIVEANAAQVTHIEYDRIYSNSYGNLQDKPILYGTSEPSSVYGNDGDIYIQYDA